jgi:hypothetical protein
MNSKSGARPTSRRAIGAANPRFSNSITTSSIRDFSEWLSGSPHDAVSDVIVNTSKRPRRRPVFGQSLAVLSPSLAGDWFLSQIPILSSCLAALVASPLLGMSIRFGVIALVNLMIASLIVIQRRCKVRRALHGHGQAL